jgi:hypothetical protein
MRIFFMDRASFRNALCSGRVISMGAEPPPMRIKQEELSINALPVLSQFSPVGSKTGRMYVTTDS